MNLEQLVNSNYNILNGTIKKVLLNRINDGLIFKLTIEGDQWNCDYGNYDISQENFQGIKSLIDIMEVLDVDDVSEFEGKNVRIAFLDVNVPVPYVGNIVYDKWFGYEDYYIKEEEPNELSDEVTEEVIDNEEVIDID